MPFLILWGFFVLLLIALFVFWIMMLVHVIRHPIQNKPLWILVILIGQGLGAIVYYFAVKRKMSEHVAAPVVTPPSAPPAA